MPNPGHQRITFHNMCRRHGVQGVFIGHADELTRAMSPDAKGRFGQVIDAYTRELKAKHFGAVVKQLPGTPGNPWIVCVDDGKYKSPGDELVAASPWLGDIKTLSLYIENKRLFELPFLLFLYEAFWRGPEWFLQKIKDRMKVLAQPGWLDTSAGAKWTQLPSHTRGETPPRLKRTPAETLARLRRIVRAEFPQPAFFDGAEDFRAEIINTPNTPYREQFLRQIRIFAEGKSKGQAYDRIFTIKGDSGTGKSTLVRQFLHEEMQRDELHIAPPCFLCRWHFEERDRPKRVWEHLAIELQMIARRVIHESRPKSDGEAFKYFRKALELFAEADNHRPVVIVIDAPDETETKPDGDLPVCERLATIRDKIPGSVGIVVSSRPTASFRSLSNQTWDIDLDETTQQDTAINAFLSDESAIPQAYVPELVERCHRSFLQATLIAAMARKNPAAFDPHKVPDGIDRFLEDEWTRIVRGLGPVGNITPLFALVSVIRRPLTLNDIAEITGIRLAQLQNVLESHEYLFDVRLPDDGGFLSYGKDTSILGFRNEHVAQHLIAFHLSDREIREAHARIVDFYQRISELGPGSGPNDGYYFERFPYHMAEGYGHACVTELLSNFDWLWKKLLCTSLDALLEDFRYADTSPAANALQGCLRLSIDGLSFDKNQLAAQLIGRLASNMEPRIRKLVEEAKHWDAFPTLTPLTQTLASPDERLEWNMQLPTGYRAIYWDGYCIVFCSSSDGVSLIDTRPCAEAPETKLCLDARNPAISVAPDGTSILMVDDGRHVSVWQLRAKAFVKVSEFVFTASRVTALALCPNGSKAVLGFDNGQIIVCNVRSGETEILRDACDEAVDTLVAWPDSCHVTSLVDHGDIYVFHLEAGQEPTKWCPAGIGFVAACISADGKLVLWVSRDDYVEKIRAVDLCSGTEFWDELDRPDVKPHYAIACCSDEIVFIQSEAFGLRVRSFGENMPPFFIPAETHDITHLAATIDGKHVVALTGQGRARKWNIQRGSGLQHVDHSRHRAPVKLIAVSSNSRYAISIDWEDGLKLWDLHSGNLIRTFLAEDAKFCSSCDVSPDGNWAVLASGPDLEFWNLKKKKLERAITGLGAPIQTIKLSHNGTKAISLSSSSQTVTEWDLTSPDVRNTVFGKILPANTMEVVGDLVVLGSRHGGPQLLDLKTGRLRPGCPDPEEDWAEYDLDEEDDSLDLEAIRELAILPGRKAVVCLNGGGQVTLCNLEDGDILEELPRFDFPGLVTRDMKGFKFERGSMCIVMLDLRTHCKIASFSADSHMDCYNVSPDGRRLLLGETEGRLHILEIP